MANITLRLDDVEEKEIEAVMRFFNEKTKSKAFSRMLCEYLLVIDGKNEYIEKHRSAKFELDRLKEALKDLNNAKERITDLLI